jgi:hypothetical protein
MCFNSKVSLLTFTAGIIFSLILIQYGNPKYKMENTITGIFTNVFCDDSIDGILLLDRLEKYIGIKSDNDNFGTINKCWKNHPYYIL